MTKDDSLPDGDLGFFCQEIARELKARGAVVRNTVTGRVVESPEDVYNFSSTGELSHIWTWYSGLFPDRVDPRDGTLHRTAYRNESGESPAPTPDDGASPVSQQ